MPVYSSDQTPPTTALYIKTPRPVSPQSTTTTTKTANTVSPRPTTQRIGLAVRDEGTNVSSSINTIDFVGGGVSTTAVGGVLTVTIESGGSGGSGGNTSATTIAGANVTGYVANATRALSAGTANVAYSVAAANVSGLGTVAALNLTGSRNTVLYGNGVFAPIPSVSSNNSGNGSSSSSFDQSLNTTDDVLFNSVTAATGFSCISAGIPTVLGGTELYLTANNRVSIQTGVFGVSTLTPERKSAIGLSDGDIYVTATDGELRAFSQGRDASVMLNVAVPTASIGAFGDVPGMFAYSTSYFYVCTDFYDGTTSIWKRTALTTW
jgi:hypothetical protein